MGYRILIVDDSRMMRSLIEKSLRTSDLDLAHVEGVGDGIAALERLDANCFDLVISDLRMPRMSGFELLDRMRGDDRLRSMPVLVISSEQSLLRMHELQARGIVAYLAKPFLPADLRAVLLDFFGNGSDGSKHPRDGG